MSPVRARELAAAAPFRALLRVRLVGQLGDGLVQAGLVGVVLFAPERAPTPLRVAAGFAVLLIPFCLVAPLAGVVLDRWSRVVVLRWANVLRACLIGLTGVATAADAPVAVVLGSALLAIGVNRLILAALGASLPRTVADHLLVSGNALAPTLGTAATVVGAGAGLALRGTTTVAGGAAPFLVAVAGYLMGALATGYFTVEELGPDPEIDGAPRHGVVSTAWSDVATGARHIAGSRVARLALAAVAANRTLFGAYTLWTVVQIRFVHPSTSHDEEHALAALGAVAVALGVGLVVAALLTPPLVRRQGSRRTAALALLIAGAGTALPLLSPQVVVLIAAWVLIGAGAQILKITVDTMLQRAVDDELRGRIFVAYDIVFNVAFVVGAAAVATVQLSVLSGVTVAAGVTAAYLLSAAAVRRSTP